MIIAIVVEMKALLFILFIYKVQSINELFYSSKIIIEGNKTDTKAVCLFDPVELLLFSAQSNVQVLVYLLNTINPDELSEPLFSTLISQFTINLEPSYNDSELLLFSNTIIPYSCRIRNQLQQHESTIWNPIISLDDVSLLELDRPIILGRYPSDHRFMLSFNEDTLMPAIHSIHQLMRYITFTPTLPQNSSIKSSNWLSSRELEVYLIMDNSDSKDINHVFWEITEIGASYNCSYFQSMYSKSISVQFPNSGIYQLSLIDPIVSIIISDTVNISISVCNNYTMTEEYILPSSSNNNKTSEQIDSTQTIASTTTVDNQHHQRSYSAQRIMHIKGILANSGSETIKIAHISYPCLHRGTFSVSFWFRLMQDYTGEYRTLLYKGNLSGQRTPSIWLLPDSNRLLIRASTVYGHDIGAESTIEILLSTWTHITFVFHNITNSRMNNDLNYNENDKTYEYEYEIIVYINGKRDISIQYKDVVIGNDEPLYLFHEQTHPGPRCFVSDFTLWDNILTKQDVHLLSSTQRNSIQYKERSMIDSTQILLQNTLLLYNNSKSNQNTDVLNEQSSATNGHNCHSLLSQLQQSMNSKTALELLEIANLAQYDDTQNSSKGNIYTTNLIRLYANAAKEGSSEALLKWANLHMYGHPSIQNNKQQQYSSSTTFHRSKPISAVQSHTHNILLALVGYIGALVLGEVKAIVPIVMILHHGIGLHEILHSSNAPDIMSLFEELYILIPVHPVLYTYLHESDSVVMQIIHIIQSTYTACTISETITSSTSSASAAMDRQDKHTDKYMYNNNLTSSSSQSVICPLHFPLQTAQSQQAQSQSHTITPDIVTDTNIIEDVIIGEVIAASNELDILSKHSLGLLFFASLYDDYEAKASLAYRYQHGSSSGYGADGQLFGLQQDIETAVYYYLNTARQASIDFHSIGGEPILETDRINDDTEKIVYKGNLGLDDEYIQLQMIHAREGHVPSILAMADLYYYGARGLPRDQIQARELYQSAGVQYKNMEGLCGAAGMALKGEGGDKNITQAIEYYEVAAKQGSIRALNGLGYLYFFGKDVPLNETRAYQYFLEAAMTQRDGDSLFNAGYCLYYGKGVQQNFHHAEELFLVAARKYGHFDSIYTLGNMYYEGVLGGKRDVFTALKYISVSSTMGVYHSWVRQGLNHYLNKNYIYAFMCYYRASELGYEVAQANAAYIIKRKLLPTILLPTTSTSTTVSTIFNYFSGNLAPEKILLKNILDRLQTKLFYYSGVIGGNKDSMLFLGHAYHEGIGIDRNQNESIYWYKQAHTRGQNLGSFYIALMYHFGLKIEQNITRAINYYEDAIGNQNKLQPTFQNIVKTLLYMAKSDFLNTYILPMFSEYNLEDVVKYYLTEK